ncbi:Low-density lipo receptor-related 11 [Brachionus plicatilis]|uniref:Low-density lipo receptor-related 11 n=1 Tax=Brachionus plicatilis TaxID=10195 RepID=A0A3M7RLU1_BRAPC|nr:Low-density lipo receptor-related 11 [Brachionus plicatilis]
MKVIVYGLVLWGLIGTLAASSFPVKGPEMYNSRAHNDLEQIVNEFIDQIDTESNFRREKKYESDTEPLLDHGRKSDPTQPSCQSHMSLFESNRMIDTKTSVKNGAKFLGVDKIEPAAQFSLKELQDACVKMCCSTDFCDTGMLSLVHGQNGYRCYMFKCSQHCLFIKHKDYVLLRQKSPEQEFDEKNIQTGHKDNIKCHIDYEFTCLKIKQCIPVYDVCDSIAHCEDKTDELNCDSNSTSTAMRQKMTTKATLDYYEDYEQDLIRQQDEILEHLRQLEARQRSDRFYHPKNFLEKFMQEDPSPRHKIVTRPSTRPSTYRVLFNVK